MASIPGYTPQRQINFEVFKAAWKLFEKNPTVWLVTTLVVVVAVGIPLLILSLFIPFIGGFLGSIPAMIILVGMFRMAFKQIRGEEISVGDAFDVSDVLAPAAVAGALFVLGTTAGFAVLIIPGLIVGGLLLFTFPSIADGKCKDGIEALKLSFETLQSELVMAAVFYLVQSLIATAGILFCGVGIFVAGPIIVLAQALLYRGYFPEQAAAPPAA
jgi:hypothetical protein